jgi:magnesium-transporting ATPase (P-type)
MAGTRTTRPRPPSAARYRWHGWPIIAVVIVNGAFSFVQEYRAERANRALAVLLPEEATALRDGRKRRVLAAELVPGDVLLLARRRLRLGRRPGPAVR